MGLDTNYELRFFLIVFDFYFRFPISNQLITDPLITNSLITNQLVTSLQLRIKNDQLGILSS